jgi:hypothetical protein
MEFLIHSTTLLVQPWVFAFGAGEQLVGIYVHPHFLDADD